MERSRDNLGQLRIRVVGVERMRGGRGCSRQLRRAQARWVRPGQKRYNGSGSLKRQLGALAGSRQKQRSLAEAGRATAAERGRNGEAMADAIARGSITTAYSGGLQR